MFLLSTTSASRREPHWCPMYVPADVRNALNACLLEVADMYPAFGSACLVDVAMLGIRPRLCLITYRAVVGHLGAQTLGASQFRSMQLRFTNAVCGLGLIRPLPLFLALSSQSLCPS